jgi:hypothetical protein
MCSGQKGRTPEMSIWICMWTMMTTQQLGQRLSEVLVRYFAKASFSGSPPCDDAGEGGPVKVRQSPVKVRPSQVDPSRIESSEAARLRDDIDEEDVQRGDDGRWDEGQRIPLRRDGARLGARLAPVVLRLEHHLRDEVDEEGQVTPGRVKSSQAPFVCLALSVSPEMR